MENKLDYSFDDEPVRKFCYDLYNKKIEVHFSGYHDLIKSEYKDTPCVWVIENWNYANSIMGDGQNLYSLDKHIGIFSLMLYVKYNDDNELEMLVNTVDNKYLTLFFKNPHLSLATVAADVSPPGLNLQT